MKRKVFTGITALGLFLCSVFVIADEFPPGQYCGSTVLKCAGDYCLIINNQCYKEIVYFGTKVYCCGQTCPPLEMGRQCTDPPPTE